MPELPDIEIYVEALRQRIVGETLGRVRVLSPFLLRSVDPPIDEAERKHVRAVQRIGKRVVLGLEDELFLVFHLMIAGRFRWLDPESKPPGRITLAVLDFSSGSLAITEAGTRKRASLHLVRGEAALAEHDPGGREVFDLETDAFADRLQGRNRTLKRALTDPRLFSGIGNAYSDEILHAARLSPVVLTQKLSVEEIGRLHESTRDVLQQWIEKLRDEFAGRFPGPGQITAFRKGFAVHGRFGLSCPDCGTKVQRIRYADNETNYCPVCQTGGRVLADRSLSRLLKNDWPRKPEDWE